ncbi:hypothetical protein POTOM_053577 [Populus tomentosa]|uniref:Alpha/beta-Hydrolases superfamily protein n=1 Tax=Populus tomentosa TaxID=118781 RepID=A0A8X8C6A8_POPTO|nr:hypothetical protein POTOM_053577 [Populus tomentosa]
MAKCLSFTAYRDWFYRYSLAKAGLRSLSSNLGDGTIVHCWVPRISKPSKPSRSGSFQAQCVMRLMEAHGVLRMNLVWISYGRFVGYSMAAQFLEKIERFVLGLAWKKRIRTMVMCTDHVKEKRELIQAILQDRNLSDLQKITQPTLTIWGEQDQIFPQIEKVNLKSSVDFGF